MEVARMKVALGPGRNKSHGIGWMSADSGQVRAAVGCWGGSFWEMGVKDSEVERHRRLSWGLDEESERKESMLGFGDTIWRRAGK